MPPPPDRISSPDPIRLPIERRRSSLIALSFLLFGALALAGFLWSALDRSDAFGQRPVFLFLLPALALAALWKPFGGALLVFLAIPFFGNFPGGRFMEILNIPLAAGTLGLSFRAWRRGSPLPRGRLWLAALLFVVSAAIALLPSLEGVAVRLSQIASLPEVVVETLTARETDPLYSLSSFVLLLLAAAWAYAIAWAVPGLQFARNALRCVAAGFAFVMVLGALDLHRLTDLDSLLRRIDERSVSFEGFQSVFWNPGWFAFYFVPAFGLVLGLIWAEAAPLRWLLGAVLAVSYFYSFANPQRGALLALHAVLGAAVIYLLGGSRSKRRSLLRAVAVVLLSAAVAVIALRMVPKPEWRGSALTRLSSGLKEDAVRKNLTTVSARMWRDFPLFGLGEGAFAWRYAEYAVLGAHLGTDAASGDAHNTYLHVLATRGLIGFAAYLFFLAALGRRVVAAAWRANPAHGIGLALGFSLIGFVAYSFFQHLLYLQMIQVLFWGIVALAAIASPEEEVIHWSGKAGLWIAAAVLAALALQLPWSWPRLKKGVLTIAREPRGFLSLEKWGETPMRWSSRSGTLCLYPSGPVVTLPVLSADPRIAMRPVTVSISAEGRLLDRFEIDSTATRARQLYLFDVDRRRRSAEAIPFGQCVAAAHPFRLTVQVGHTWSPFSQRLSGDTRHLGVAVFEPSFAPTQPATDLGLSPSETEGHRQFRWTGARASIGIQLPAERAAITLPLRAGNPDLKRRPVRVEAFWNDRPAASTSLSTFDWQELRFEVIAPDRWGVLTLQVDRVWQPKAYGVGDSLRYLGVQMGVPRVEAAAPAGNSKAPTDHS